MWDFVVTHFNSYAGWGLIFFYYLAAVIWLLVTEKRKERRILFVYMPLVILILFFLPPVAKLIVRFADEEVYYRLLWMLPVSVTVAYTLTEIVLKMRGKLRVILIIASAVLIMIGGRLIYTDERYSVAENEYHMPQAVVDICDKVVIPGREVRVAFPSEHLTFVRQYTALVVMPYGWDDIKLFGEGSDNRLREILDSDAINAEELANETRWKACHYVVVGEDKKLNGNPADYGLEEYTRTDGYVIYKNPEMDFSIPNI